MKTNPASINDIAKALGVSASTVSRALKDHPDISETTRNRIKEFALKINYRPNALALSLKKQKSNTIGIIIPEIIHHFFSSLISGVEDIAYNKGYRVMICQSNEDFEREKINVQALVDHRVDGMLVCFSKNTDSFEHMANITDSGLPLVVIDRSPEDFVSDKVITDDYNGARLIVRHLIETGCKNILHLGTAKSLTVGYQRRLGYLKELTENSIKTSDEMIIECDTPQRVRIEQYQILDKAKKADALFAVNDFTAVAAMNLLKNNGFRIPEDITIAGFGDDPIATITNPSLTTVRQKGYQMGQQAMLMLIEKLNRQNDGNQSVQKKDFETKVFEVELKIRESTTKQY